MSWFRRKKKEVVTPDEKANQESSLQAKLEDKVEKPPEDKKQGVFARLKSGLKRTRSNLVGGLEAVFKGKKVIDDDLLEEIETRLLTADVGVEVTQQIIDDLTQQLQRKELASPEALLAALKDKLYKTLEPLESKLNYEDNKPYVLLVVGVNGSGKTTTIGKLAYQLKNSGKKVMLAAGDTFRAAAIDQLQRWGERNDIPVVAQKPGSDSAAVIYDAIQSAKSKGFDVLLADTAGRLHTQSHLMAELEKVVKVIKKVDPSAPHEVMLVLDSGIGQNALTQATQFQESVNVTGFTLTKLDGTAKGGIVFALANKLKLPIRFIGLGEKPDDLREFDAKAFVEALFSE